MNLLRRLDRAPDARSPSGDASVLANGHSNWRLAVFGLSAAVVLQLAVFWEATSEIVATWSRSATFNHGFLILPIVGYLIWVRRQRLLAAVASPRPALWGLGLMAAPAFAWLLADAANVLLIQQFALVGMIQVTVLTVFGWRAARVLAFPLAYLLFAVPFGEFLVPRLQTITADFAVDALRLVGIPVFVDGLFITIPTGRFHVAEACSGIRFLIACIALGALFANMMYRSPWRRAAFMVLSVVVPIVANGFRAFGIIVLAYVSNNEIAVGFDHLIYGWIFFSIVIVLMLALGALFRERQDDTRHGADAGAAIPTDHASSRLIACAIAGCAAVALTAPAYAELTAAAPSTRRIELTAPAGASGWRLAPDHVDRWRPRFAGADATLQRSYVGNGGAVHLFVAYYADQRQGAEAVAQSNKIEGAGFWSRTGGGSATAIVDGAPLQVRSMRLVRGSRGRVVWYWYWIDGQYTASALRAKWLEARARLLGGRRASAAIAVAADYDETPVEAARILRGFLEGQPPLRRILEVDSND